MEPSQSLDDRKQQAIDIRPRVRVLLIDDSVVTLDEGKAVSPLKTEEGCSSEDLRILALVAAGKTDKEIAHQLDLAPRVITTRLRRMYQRVKISRRSETAQYFAQAEKSLAH
jgi:DNA-binding NarL/FixJ family response regulator